MYAIDPIFVFFHPFCHFLKILIFKQYLQKPYRDFVSYIGPRNIRERENLKHFRKRSNMIKN